MDGVLAQLVERLVRNEKVRSSSLLGSTIIYTRAFLRPLSVNPVPTTPSIWRQFVWVALGIVVAYFVVFQVIEAYRRAGGPWVLTFALVDHSPALTINHDDLDIRGVELVFSGGHSTNPLPQTVRFQHGQVAPLGLPFGRCLFLDTLVLPGRAACEIFGHQIQLLPSALIIDEVRHPWQSGQKFLLTNQTSATLPAH
jgi:hypothetical protein